MIRQARYNVLIRQFKNKIYTFSLYMLKNKMDADDVTQEVMIRLWNNLDKFNILAVKTWIMKTTYNVCIDFLRRRSASLNRMTEIDEVFEDTFSKDSALDNPYLLTHYKMMDIQIKEAIQRLPENLRSVFVLYQIENFKYKEISKMLDMPMSSVKVNILRARKKLQEELKNYDLQEII